MPSWMRRLSARFLGHESRPRRVLLLLDAYLRLGRRPGRAEPLDSRLELLVSQLSAELSGCRWCIEAGRHRWRKASLPVESLKLLLTAGDAECFSERERAALAFAGAVAQAAATDGLVPRPRPGRRAATLPGAGNRTAHGPGRRRAFRRLLSPGSDTDTRPPFPIAVRGLS